MSEVEVGQKVHVKEHLVVDAVPFGPGLYEVVDADGAVPGDMTPEIAKRATAKKSNAEVLSKDASTKKTREAAKSEAKAGANS